MDEKYEEFEEKVKSEPATTGRRVLNGAEMVVAGLALLGALCVLPILSCALAIVVKVSVGLACGALGLVVGIVSLAFGLIVGAIGLVIGIIGAVAGFLVTPPGLLLVAALAYFHLRDE
jgi:uncharacterized membrane protein YkgB